MTIDVGAGELSGRRPPSAPPSRRPPRDADGRRPGDGRDQRHLAHPAPTRRRRSRSPACRRRPVGDHADGVDRLAGSAGGDDHADPGEVVRAEHASTAATIRSGRREAAGTDVAAGQPAGVGVDDVRRRAAQRVEVLLDRRVLPHLGVHRRADHDRRPRRSSALVSRSVDRPAGMRADQPSGGRHDEDQVGGLAEPGVRDRRVLVPEAGLHRLAGQGGQGGAADEALGGLRSSPGRRGRRRRRADG